MKWYRSPSTMLIGIGVVAVAGTLVFAQLTQPAAPRAAAPSGTGASQTQPVVLMNTSLGEIRVRLFPDKAPISVANFLGYVNDGFYDGTVFHRVIPDFMIQGGGYTPDLSVKTGGAPIPLEAQNGLKNVRGSVAMARMSAPDSATSEFYINVVDNPALDYPRPDGQGYAVFGEVVEGMEIVDRIAHVQTARQQGMGDVPITPVVIQSMRVVSNE